MPSPSPTAETQRLKEELVALSRSAAIIAAVAELARTLHAAAMSNADQPQDVRKVTANVLIKVIDLSLELYPRHPEWVIPIQQISMNPFGQERALYIVKSAGQVARQTSHTRPFLGQFSPDRKLSSSRDKVRALGST